MASRLNCQFYRSWESMKQRCNNLNHASYARYGGRGISYDPQWEKFDNFFNDMAKSWENGLTLERIDNTKGYSAENCRWATPKEQANNRRSSRLFTIDGVTRTLQQWIDTTPLKTSTVKQRYYAYSYSIEQALGLEAIK